MNNTPLIQVDIDKVDALATQMCHFRVNHGYSMDHIMMEQLKVISLAVSSYVTIHGTTATHSLLDALGVAIDKTYSEQIHDAFLMALDVKMSVQEEIL
jgi:hypothetical protein